MILIDIDRSIDRSVPREFPIATLFPMCIPKHIHMRIPKHIPMGIPKHIPMGIHRWMCFVSFLKNPQPDPFGYPPLVPKRIPKLGITTSLKNLVRDVLGITMGPTFETMT
jgi:hypothetical protein